ncbi:Hypothetical protein FKW44_004689, partial [Caligus rogercresseyi]
GFINSRHHAWASNFAYPRTQFSSTRLIEHTSPRHGELFRRTFYGPRTKAIV